MSNQLEIIQNTVTESAANFASTLTQYQWNLLPDSQLHAAKIALTKNDFIMKIAAGNPESVHDSLMQAAILGLDLTEGKKQGWLVPRKNQQNQMAIVLQVGYKGVEAIHQRMGVIDRLAIRVVRKNDEFKWSGDDQEKPEHTADWFASDKDRGEIVGAFAVTYYPDKTIGIAFASVTEIFEKHRDKADSYKSYATKKASGQKAFPPPWVTYEKEMIEKTMAYIASKAWPANMSDEGQSSKILETLHDVDVADYSLQFSPEQRDLFYQLIKDDDALGMRLFTAAIGIEGYAALARTFPKGEKVSGKENLARMDKEGYQIIENIKEAISANDTSMIQENIEGAGVFAIKMVKRELGDHQLKVFEEKLAEIAA